MVVVVTDLANTIFNCYDKGFTSFHCFIGASPASFYTKH